MLSWRFRKGLVRDFIFWSHFGIRSLWCSDKQWGHAERTQNSQSWGLQLKPDALGKKTLFPDRAVVCWTQPRPFLVGMHAVSLDFSYASDLLLTNSLPSCSHLWFLKPGASLCNRKHETSVAGAAPIQGDSGAAAAAARKSKQWDASWHCNTRREERCL